MASIGFDIFPDPQEIRECCFPDNRPRGGNGPFSILYLAPNAGVYICDRYVLDALQAALDKIRADMDAETAVVAS